MNPERIAELERQRDLVRAHLAWLDRELASARQDEVGAQGASETVAPATRAESAIPVPGLAPAPLFASALAAETVLEDYQPDPRSNARSARRGCLLLAVGAFLLLFGTVAAVLALRYGDRPMLFMEHSGPDGGTPQK